MLRLPGVGWFLRQRWARLGMQIPLLLLSVVLVWHGFLGPDLAPKNLATLLTWVHYRGLLVLVLLVAGNFFCMACPFLLPREIARWIFRPVWNWPVRLRNKWLAVALFVLLLFAYEYFGLWSTPFWTAWLIVAYFAGALVVDALFRHASFCKWVCPIGQFNFLASTLSPLEVAVRDLNQCVECRTKDCICGPPASETAADAGRLALPLLAKRGCELALFQPMKVGNLDCTFCLDCVHACPHDNVGLVTRMPGAELAAEEPRSGLGNPLTRPDLAALAIVFTFGALLNAFGMVSPVYVLQAWLSGVLGTTERAPILAILFAVALIVEPVLLLGLAAWWTRRATGTALSLPRLATRYAYSLVPLGFGVWLAHYAFHFLTGALTVVPVLQNALAEIGWPVLGQPNWEFTGMRSGSVFVLELGFLTLGLVGSWIVAIRLARKDQPSAPWRAYLSWVVLQSILWAAAIWLLAQPMEMRGTFLGD
ncbi:MAG: FesM [Planctomycetes bacterium]|nr:FesM [Planctomycetota bacterium]